MWWRSAVVFVQFQTVSMASPVRMMTASAAHQAQSSMSVVMEVPLRVVVGGVERVSSRR